MTSFILHAGLYLNFRCSHVSVCLGKSLQPPTCLYLFFFVSNGSTTGMIHAGERLLGFLALLTGHLYKLVTATCFSVI